MSDWLERELTRAMAPAEAPEALRIRLGLGTGLPTAPRSDYSRAKPSRDREGAVRGLVAIAAAVIMIIGGGYTTSRYAALDLPASSSPARDVIRASWVRQDPAPDDPRRPSDVAPPTDAWRFRCDGGAASASSPLLIAANPTVLLAHSGSTAPAHKLTGVSELGCHQCHSL